MSVLADRLGVCRWGILFGDRWFLGILASRVNAIDPYGILGFPSGFMI
ncbi:MAG: hypothetical protein H7237_05825 [Alkalinema sp. FL-bin-369]|nr:hypothetical protein [Leptolyngbyaceae cyanobacterium LF-bin-369]